MTETARAYHARNAAAKAARQAAPVTSARKASRPRSTRPVRRCPDGNCSSFGDGRSCGLPGCDGWS